MVLAIHRAEGQVVYFAAGVPVFCHAETDPLGRRRAWCHCPQRQFGGGNRAGRQGRSLSAARGFRGVGLARAQGNGARFPRSTQRNSMRTRSSS
jgi:hypothetical protein